MTESALGKLIAKTAAVTLACIIALMLVLFGVFTVLFPSVMLRITDLCGMEKACTQYAVSVYSRSKEIDDLANVVERGYVSASWKIVSEYGEKLLARADFYDYCAAEDEKSDAEEDGRITSSYAQYMTGLVSVGKYRTGDGKGAMETAFLLNRNSFPENNAVVTLAMSVIERGDAVFASELLSECKAQMDKVDFDKEQDVQNLQTMISILEDFCA